MKFSAENTVPIVLPESEVQDIDNEEDWKIAEIKFKNLLTQQVYKTKHCNHFDL